MAKDFMSTQVGGEGETLQMIPQSPQLPQEFSANITPAQPTEEVVAQPTAPIEAKPTASITSAESNVVDQAVEESTVDAIDETASIESSLGLSTIDIPTYDSLIPAEDKKEFVAVDSDIYDEPETVAPVQLKTVDGLMIAGPGQTSNIIPVIEQPSENINTVIPDYGFKTVDGLMIRNPNDVVKEEIKKVNTEYKDSNVSVSDDNKVKIVPKKDGNPIKEGVIYRLPGKEGDYQFIGGAWHRDIDGKGNWTALSTGDVAKRSEYLNKNAVYFKTAAPKKDDVIYKVPGSDTKYKKSKSGWLKDLGNGTYSPLKEGDVAKRNAYLDKVATPVSSSVVNKANALVTPYMGNLRDVDQKSTVSGGDPVVSGSIDFRSLTRENKGSESEPFNQDGTRNLSYDPSTNNPFYIKGKDDGVYAIKGSSNSYKKENGNWFIATKGSTEYKPIIKGNIEERIHQIELNAYKPAKLSDAMIASMSPQLIAKSSVDPVSSSLKAVKTFSNNNKSVDSGTSFKEASEFVNKDINTIISDNLTPAQKKTMLDFQAQAKEIVKDGEFTTEKGIKASAVLKEAEAYFNEAKEINTKINEAEQQGKSLSRASFDKKLATYKEYLGASGAVSVSNHQQQSVDLFEATSEMASFIIDNVDNGNMRYDKASNQYLFSPNISSKEKSYLEEKLGMYMQEYDQIQKEKYSETNQKIQEQKSRLTALYGNIDKINSAIDAMEKSGVSASDPKYKSYLVLLETEKNKIPVLKSAIHKTEMSKSTVFLTDPKKVAVSAASNLSGDTKTILSAIPKDITPKQQFDLFYERLMKQNGQLAKDNGINNTRLGAVNMSAKDFFNWEGFYSLSDVEKRYLKNEATLNQLAPIYYNNDLGFSEEETGFFESFMDSFYTSLFPNKAASLGYTTQSTSASTINEVLVKEGFSPDDYVDSNVIDRIKEKAVVDTLSSREGWGRMTGTTAAIIVPLVLTKNVPSSSLKLVSGMEKLLLGKNSAVVADLVTDASKIYNTTLKSTKVGRFIAPAIEQGARFEVAGRGIGTNDELYFLSGFAGGVASELFVGLVDKLPKEEIYSFLGNIFGSKTNLAVQTFVKSGKMASQGIAETAEEVTQEMSNIYRDTDNFKDMMAEISSRFGTLDQVQEFVVSSFIMGAAFGLNNNAQTKTALDSLSDEKKAVVMKVLSEVQSDLDTAKDAKEEFVDNKLEQQSIEENIKEDDTKDKAGVSGEVKEGQEPIKAEPIGETGKEEVGPGGVVQETPTEVEPTTVKATSFEEATRLFKEGYKPVINGKVQEGNLVGLESLFNTMPEVQMQKEGSPKTMSVPLTEDEVAGKEEVESSTGIITTKNPIKVLKGLFGKKNADGSVRTAHPDIKGTWGALDENIAKRYKGDDEKILTEFSIPAGTTVETIEIEETNVPVSELRKAETDAVNNSTAQVVRLITMDSGSSKKESQIIIKDANLAKAPDTSTEEVYINEPTTPEESKSLADKVREGKIGGKGLVTSSIPGFEQVWDTSVEVVAKIIEGGESINKAVQKGFEVMKGSEWYQSLSKEQRDQALVDYNDAMNNQFPKKRVSKAEREAAKEFKGKVAEVTGTVKPGKVYSLTESEALKEIARNQSKGIKELQKVKTQVAEYAKKMLPKESYSKTELRTVTDAIAKATEKNIEAVIDKIDGLVAKKQQQRIDAKVEKIKEIASNKRTLFSKKGANKWVGKGTIESQEEFKSFIEGINFEELNSRTEEEVDAIAEAMNDILTNGYYDRKAITDAEDKARRVRAASLLKGLAGEPDTVLGSLDEAEEFLNNGGTVIVNGEAFSKSSFREFTSKYKKVEATEGAITDLKDKLEALKQEKKDRLSELIDSDSDIDTDKQLKSIDNQINKTRESISKKQAALESALENKPEDISGEILGYTYQSPNIARASSEQISNSAIARVVSRGLALVNPLNAMHDIYSLLKSAGVKNSNVYGFVKKHLTEPIANAFFRRNENYEVIIKNYRDGLDRIFGKSNVPYAEGGSLGIKRLGELLDPSNFMTSRVGKAFPLTNGHIVDWYNLSLTRNGEERLKKSGVNVEAVKAYMADGKNSDLKAYSDYIMESYKLAGTNYEGTYESVMNSKFPKDKEYPYYPSYSESFDRDVVSESSFINPDGSFRSMDAMSDNMKQRNDFTGPLNIEMDSHSKYLDYIKTMEHAKQFLPIAKSVNELFSKANTPYLIKEMGIDNYDQLRIHLSTILTNEPVTSFKNTTTKTMGKILNLQVLATLAGKPSSVIKQFTSFTHYWVAGISEGLNPADVMAGWVPKNKKEYDFILSLYKSNYVKSRFSGEGLDYELKRLKDEAVTSKASRNFNKVAKFAMAPVRAGDISVLIGPGGGTSYAVAIYRQKLSEGMSDEDAQTYAYKAFVTETELAQQSSRADVTSNIQRDPAYRMIATYRTAQTSAVKKVLNGIKTLNTARVIQKKEGADARRSVISDRDLTQAVVDIAYFSALSSLFFSAVTSGAIFFLASDEYSDEEKKRMWFDMRTDQAGAILQGLGISGFLADWGFNYATGNDWKNNIPVIKKMIELTALAGSYFELSTRQYKDLEKSDKEILLQEQTGQTSFSTMEDVLKMNSVIDNFNNSWAWSKRTAAEVKRDYKTLGLGNIMNLKSDFKGRSEGKSDIIDVLMNYDADYFEKAKESGRKNPLYEWWYGEPYLPEVKEKKSDTFLPEMIEEDMETKPLIKQR